jgi:hypothetical protein
MKLSIWEPANKTQLSGRVTWSQTATFDLVAKTLAAGCVEAQGGTALSAPSKRLAEQQFTVVSHRVVGRSQDFSFSEFVHYVAVGL